MTQQQQQKSASSSWDEFVPGAAWCVEQLLTENECQGLISEATQQGIQSLTFQGDTRHRQRVRVTINDATELLDRLWERVRYQIPQEVIIDENTIEQNEGFRHVASSDCLVGRWTPSRLNPSINVARCMGVGHLAAHRDAEVVAGEHERSFLTINGFLTSRPEGSGGATRFLREDIPVTGAGIVVDPDNDVLYRAEPNQAGKAVVFLHGLVHDGEPLVEGSPEKWIFRSAIYYKRDPETAPKMTAKEKEARALLKQAEEAEESGRIAEAMKLYSRAYRLDPSLE